MKKLFATLLTLTLIVGAMATTAFATETVEYSPHSMQIGALSISNVIYDEPLNENASICICEDLPVITIEEDVSWVNTYFINSQEQLMDLPLLATTDGVTPVFDCSNLTIVVEETKAEISFNAYLEALIGGTMDEADAVYIKAGSTLILMAQDLICKFQVIDFDGDFSETCVFVYNFDFDGIPTVLEETTEPEVTEPDEISFPDVSEEDAYYDAVMWAVEAGVTTGYADGAFRPDTTCTRGQVVTFLYRAMGEPEVTTTENPFSDVSEDSAFYDAILWAVENGITAGYDDGTFRASTTCSSAQVLTFLYRAMGEPETDFESEIAATAAAAYAPSITWADSLSLLDADFVGSSASPRSDIVTYLYQVLNS